jgi:hypothetical protein
MLELATKKGRGQSAEREKANFLGFLGLSVTASPSFIHLPRITEISTNFLSFFVSIRAIRGGFSSGHAKSERATFYQDVLCGGSEILGA